MELFQTYPFLPSMRNYFPELYRMDVEQFVNHIFDQYNNDIIERCNLFFDTLFQNKENIENYKFDKTNVYFYFFLRILIHYFLKQNGKNILKLIGLKYLILLRKCLSPRNMS